MRYVALLRGINVGGNRILPMKDLKALFEKLGYTEVSTYIQSGNVVFGASAALAKGIASAVDKAIQAKFGFSVPIVVRSAAEMEAIAKGNPYLKSAPAESLHVAFLAQRPTAALAKALTNPGVDGEKFELKGSEIYLMFPKGLAKTKVTNAYFDSKLQTISTVRNWRTTLALLEMAKGGKA